MHQQRDQATAQPQVSVSSCVRGSTWHGRARIRARCFVGMCQAAKKVAEEAEKAAEEAEKAAEEVCAMAACDVKRMRCDDPTRMRHVVVSHDNSRRRVHCISRTRVQSGPPVSTQSAPVSTCRGVGVWTRALFAIYSRACAIIPYDRSSAHMPPSIAPAIAEEMPLPVFAI